MFYTCFIIYFCQYEEVSLFTALDLLEDMNGIDRKSAAKIARFLSSKVSYHLI